MSGARPTASHVAPASSVRYTVPRPSTTSALGPPNGSTPSTPPPTPPGGPSSRRTPAESGPHVSPPSSLTHPRAPTCPLIRPAIPAASPPARPLHHPDPLPDVVEEPVQPALAERLAPVVGHRHPPLPRREDPAGVRRARREGDEVGGAGAIAAALPGHDRLREGGGAVGG